LLLNLLRDPRGELDINSVILAISQVPEGSAEYDARLKEATAELDAGKDIGEVLSNVRSKGIFSIGPKTVGGLGAAK